MLQTGKGLAVQEYIELLKKYRMWILISILGMAMVFGGVRYMTYKPMFTAQTSLLVTSNTIELEEGEIKNGTTSSDYNVSNNVLMTFSEVINSQTLQSEVKEELSIEDLGEITVSNNGGSVIRINVNHSDATLAALIANTTAKEFTKMIQSMMSDINLQVLDPAMMPQDMTGMGLLKVVMMGAVVGLVVVVGIILVREMLDTTLKLPKDIEREIEIPLLGAIPDVEPELKTYMKGNRG